MFPKSEVVLFHNVVGEQLLSYLHNDTDRSYKVSMGRTGGVDAKSRLSAVSYLYPRSSEESLRLFQLVSRVTGLDVMRRSMQITSYPPGGHFLAHADTVRKP